MPPAFPDVEDVTSALLANNAVVLSVDGIKTFHKCARKYQLQTLRRMRWPADTRNFRLGQHVHKLMDYQAYANLGLPLNAVLPAATNAEKSAFERLEKESSVAGWPVLASEWGFNLRLSRQADWPASVGAVFIRGRMDRLVLQPETHHVVIVDWKTGTAIPKQPEHDFQTLIYALAVDEASEHLPVPKQSALEGAAPRLAFVYVGVSSNLQKPLQEIRIDFDAPRLHLARKEVLAEVSAMLKAMAADQFALPAYCPDRYCPFRTVCGIATQDSATNLSK
ncbi:MAG: PD-(D/E)XK nuclease family protein [Vampirovibrionales bacterium]|nr:PD-(D/E)XK nuclease family protein [Vampirovibrionales bacterium]